MAIGNEVLDEIKCCLNNNGHFTVEPVELPCKGFACKKCYQDAINYSESKVNCFHCNKKHEKNSLVKTEVNDKSPENLIKTSLNDLLEFVEKKLENTNNELKESSLLNDLNDKVEIIENEMDLRVESLIEQIHNYRQEFQTNINKVKDEIIKTIKPVEFRFNENKIEDQSIELFQQKQNQLKDYQIELENFKEKLKKFEFVPSKFNFENNHFGEILHRCGLNDSLILNRDECLSLFQMINSSHGKLLYRATRDGFTSQAFHSKCDNIANTVTIIKNNLNFVFGGYTSAAWISTSGWKNDPNAFIFSLRRNGKSTNEKFLVKHPEYAIYGFSLYGPTFGSGHDIHVCNESNKIEGSFSCVGYSYVIPDRYRSEDVRNFLSGNYNQWLSKEIEVYEIN